MKNKWDKWLIFCAFHRGMDGDKFVIGCKDIDNQNAIRCASDCGLKSLYCDIRRDKELLALQSTSGICRMCEFEIEMKKMKELG